MTTPFDPSTSPAWATLTALAMQDDHQDLRALFAADDGRAEHFTVQACDLRVDFSKQLVTRSVVDALVWLADERAIAAEFDAMRSGATINTTEDRAVLHTALRRSRDDTVMLDGENVLPEIHAVLDKMRVFAEQVRSGAWLGSNGARIRTVVNIGIGGSDLGPAMATIALSPFADHDIDVRFISNVDPADLVSGLRGVDPAATLFVVASKTFTTIETMSNATTARDWLRSALGHDVDIARHFVALSTNAGAVAEFGIDPTNMFGFWDWVGGRYSLPSAIGLSLMISIGPAHFDDFLAGYRAMDAHAATAPTAANGPFLAGLIGVWNRNLLGHASHAVLPYAEGLRRFPAYLQQLDMESNGKSVMIDGSPATLDTAPIGWGEPGTNGQHAFYQMLHQGTTVVPADLIGFLATAQDAGGQHLLLFANMIAQAEALAFGKTAAEVAANETVEARVPHRTFPGNRPTTTITAPLLTPGVLGQLIAFYEHKVFAQGVIWGINSFDQWGVELGKELATTIAAELDGSDGVGANHDSSTSALIDLYRSAHV